MPSRLKIGDNEAAWEGVEQFVREVAEEVPADQTPELVSALSDLAEVAPAAAAAGLSAITSRTSYEHLVTSILLEAVAEINRVEQVQGFSPGRVIPLNIKIETAGGLLQTHSDAEISDRAGKLLVIEVKYLSSSLRSVLAMQMKQQVRRYATSLKTAASEPRISALLISNKELPRTVLNVLETMAEPDLIDLFQHIRVESKNDLPELISAIRMAFGIGN